MQGASPLGWSVKAHSCRSVLSSSNQYAVAAMAPEDRGEHPAAPHSAGDEAACRRARVIVSDPGDVTGVRVG